MFLPQVLCFAVSWLTLIGCECTPDESAPRAARVVHRSRELMGTIYTVQVVLGEPAGEVEAAAAAEAALDEVARLESVLSEWRSDSEISQINAAAGLRPVAVSVDTFAVVQAGIEVSRWSDGAFDMSWAAMRALYDFRSSSQRRPTQAELASHLPLVDYRKISLDPQQRTVMLEQTGMQIGTGGIGKGYALDRAAALLLEAGWTDFMLFGGGQVQVYGRKAGRPWRVGIQHPRQQDYIGHMEVSDVSISTSGDYEHAFIEGERRWHHIIDPRTGLPVDHTSSVTVLASIGTYADAVSTAIFVLGPRVAMSRLRDAPGRPQAVVIDHELKLFVSPGLDEQLVVRLPLERGELGPAH